MTKEERYQKTAEQLLKLVGGKENIISAAHCATRLRLVLKDEAKANVEEIVNEVYKRFIETGGIAESSKNDVKQAATQKMNPV